MIKSEIRDIIILQIHAKQLHNVYDNIGVMNMAEQVLIQFRADKALQQEVADIYEQLGMDLPTAFRMFMTRSKMVKGLPFEATLPADTITRTDAINAFWEARNQASDVQEMSLDEINAEISAARAERKK